MLALIIPLSELGGSIPGIGNQLPVPPGAHPGQGLPWGPGHPEQGLPPFPGRPGQDLPHFPGTPGHDLPQLPPDPARPSQPIALPPQSGNLPVYPVPPGTTIPPGVIWPPLGPGAPQGKALALVAISGVGYRWAVIDTSLVAGMPLPGGPPPTAGTPLPPYGQPKV
jgi:hypothetical protein